MKLFLPFATLLIVLLINPVTALAATLSLTPSSGTFNKGCNFTVDIKLDTAGVQTDGTDAILKYDNSKITATSISLGTIYADYPGNNIDDTTGKVTTSGLASVTSAFSGVGTLATVSFLVKENAATGATMISFDFDPNNKTNTTDSNVVQKGTIADVLSSVNNGSYTIGTGVCSGATPAPVVVLPGTGRGAATGSGQVKTLDQMVDQTGKGPGTSELTFTIAIIGSVLTVLGILGIALL